MDSRDDNLFPTKGLFIDAEAEFFATDFHEQTSPFGTFRLNFNGAIRLSRIFTLLPAFYGRTIIGNSNSLPVMNFVGGNIYGRYFSHQLPFVGINYADLVGKSTVIGRLDLCSEVAKKHYVSAILNYMRDGENVGALFNSNGRNTIGAGVEYTYSSPIGPISLNINWSDKRDNVSAYVNIGYYF
jgi:NTE family protein